MSISYESAVLKKMKKIFLGKHIEKYIELYDENGYLIDNIIYFSINGGFWGFYLNGCGPFVTPSFIDDVDAFNLYSLYESITFTEVAINSNFYVAEMEVFLDGKYNELHGALLIGKNLIIGIIFMYDEISLIFPKTREEFTNNMREKLSHVNMNIIRTVSQIMV